MPGKAYLNRTMLARLLACLALVTGLAAVGAPAHSALLTAASQQVEADGSSSNPSKNQSCTCSDPRNVGKATDSAQAKCRARKPVVIYIPTVQFGADRAYE